ARRALRRGRARPARAAAPLRRLRCDAVRRLSPGAADDDPASRGRRGARARLGAGMTMASGLFCSASRPAGNVDAWRRARRLLVIRADNIGDVVMTGPALRAVKRARPECELTLLASPAGSEAAPLLPWIDDVLTRRVLW